MITGTGKISGVFTVDHFYLKPFSRTLPLSHHTGFPTRKRILQQRKRPEAVGSPAAALISVNERVEAVVAHEKLEALSITALVTLRDSEVENVLEMMAPLFDALVNPSQKGAVVLQLVSTDIDPSKNSFALFFFFFFFFSGVYSIDFLFMRSDNLKVELGVKVGCTCSDKS
jgi:hypothetical protein